MEECSESMEGAEYNPINQSDRRIKEDKNENNKNENNKNENNNLIIKNSDCINDFSLHCDDECRTVHQLRQILTILFLNTFATVLAMPLYPFILVVVMGLSSKSYGILISCNSLCHLCCAILYGKISDIVGRRPLVILQAFLGIIIYASIAVVLQSSTISDNINNNNINNNNNTSVVIRLCILFILIGATNVLATLCNSSICDLLSNPNERAEWLAKVGGVQGLSLALAPVLGFALQSTGQYFIKTDDIDNLNKINNNNITGIQNITNNQNAPAAIFQMYLAATIFFISFIICCFWLPETSNSARNPIGPFLKKLNFINKLKKIKLKNESDDLKKAFLINNKNSEEEKNNFEILNNEIKLLKQKSKEIKYEILINSASHQHPLTINNNNILKNNKNKFDDDFLCIDSFPASDVESSSVDSSISNYKNKNNYNLKNNDNNNFNNNLNLKLRWKSSSIFTILFSQFAVAMSLCCLNIPYGLLIGYLIPPSSGIPSSYLIGFTLTCAGTVFVVIQLFLYSTLLQKMKSITYLFATGCIMMSFGQVAVFETIAWIQPIINNINLILPFEINQNIYYFIYFILFFIHISCLCLLFYAGSAMAEPSVAVLMSLQISNKLNKLNKLNKNNNNNNNLRSLDSGGMSISSSSELSQGVSQGALTASRYLALVIGPPLCGWLMSIPSATTQMVKTPKLNNLNNNNLNNNNLNKRKLADSVDTSFHFVAGEGSYILNNETISNLINNNNNLNNNNLNNNNLNDNNNDNYDISFISVPPEVTVEMFRSNFYLGAILALAPLLFFKKLKKIGHVPNPSRRRLSSTSIDCKI